MNKSLLIAALFVISIPAYAENLADLIDKQIQLKAEEAKAKETANNPIFSPAGATNQPIALVATTASRDEVKIGDIQVLGIMGVGEDLKAKVRVKESQLTLMRNQTLQGGITLVSLSPNMVVFEKYETAKKGGKSYQKLLLRKEILISGAGQYAGGGRAMGINMDQSLPSPPIQPGTSVRVPALH